MNDVPSTLKQFLDEKVSNARAPVIGMAASLFLALLVLATSLWTWFAVRDHAVNLERVMRTKPPDSNGIALAEHMREVNNTIVSVEMGVVLSVTAIALMFFFDLRFKRKLRRTLVYLQTPEGMNELATFSKRSPQP